MPARTPALAASERATLSPQRRSIATRAAAVTALLIALTIAPAPSPAHAADPLISSPAVDAFINRNSLAVGGAGSELGATVTVTVNGNNACTTAVTDDGGALVWSCTIPLSNGADRVITATETLADESTRSESRTVDVLGAPTIDGHSPTIAVVSGTGHPGSAVTVGLTGTSLGCSATVGAGGYWSCSPPLAGAVDTTRTVTAAQSNASIRPSAVSSAASRAIHFDNVAPASPALTSPVGDYRIVRPPATFTGTSAEPDARVTVYVDGQPVCEAQVASGLWTCMGAGSVSDGAHHVTVRQQDAAGNVGTESAPLRVFFGPRATAPTPEQPSPTPTPDTSETPSSPPSSSPEPTRRPVPIPVDPGGVFSEPDPTQALGNWGSRTSFGAALPGVSESVTHGNWARAPIVAAGSLLLIGLPLFLAAGALRGRIRRPFGRLTGRNRDYTAAPPTLLETAKPFANPWLAGLLPLAATTVFIVVSGGVTGEVRYLRLTAAVGIGLVIINIVGVALAARLGYLWQKIDGRLRFAPLLLAAAGITGILSRTTGLTPPIVTGAIIGVAFTPEATRRQRALVQLLQPVALLTLGIAGWVGHGGVADVVGFWPSLLREILATLALTGVGSAFVLMLPVGSLPGRDIIAWNPFAWIGISFAGATVGFAILLGGPAAFFPLAPTLVLAVIFAAACLGIWAVMRYLAPAAASQPAGTTVPLQGLEP